MSQGSDTTAVPPTSIEMVLRDPWKPPAAAPMNDGMQSAPDKPMPMDRDAVDGKERVSGLTQGEILTQEAANQVRADSLVGRDVVNTRGEDLGKVEDILLDDSGQVAGLIVSTGGVLGIGAKSVGVAWYDVGNSMHSDSINLPLSKAQLEQAPAFVKSKPASLTSTMESDDNGGELAELPAK